MYRIVRVDEPEHPLGMPSPVVELFRVTGRDRTLTTMARHAYTQQLLAALDGRRWGMWLAAPADEPRDPLWVEVPADQALLLDAGTWHHGPIPLEGEAGSYLTVEAPCTNRDDFETRPVVAGPRVG